MAAPNGIPVLDQDADGTHDAMCCLAGRHMTHREMVAEFAEMIDERNRLRRQVDGVQRPLFLWALAWSGFALAAVSAACLLAERGYATAALFVAGVASLFAAVVLVGLRRLP